MQKTINHTGRRKIEVKELQIRLNHTDNHSPSFDVDFSLKASTLPSNAAIYIEAYQRNTLQRFHFGTVSNITKPENRILDQLDLSSPTLFRIRVVDESDHIGRLIASAEGLRPTGDGEDDNHSSLLTVRSRPLGEVTWKVEFETGGKPELCINSRIPSAIEQLKTNPQFQSLILPAAFRQVLLYFLWDNNEDNTEFDNWIRFAEHIATPRPDERDPSILMPWIDDVIDRFSQQFELCNMLINRMEASND